jgi:hypothetical protein
MMNKSNPQSEKNGAGSRFFLYSIDLLQRRRLAEWLKEAFSVQMKAHD